MLFLNLKENFVWSSVGGRKVCLGSFDICDLTEPERIALQQVALSKLRKLNLRSHVTIPKCKCYLSVVNVQAFRIFSTSYGRKFVKRTVILVLDARHKFCFVNRY